MNVLLFGGSGHFGGRIYRRLKHNSGISVSAPGRDALDINAPDLAERLRAREVGVVIHTAGPFQGQDYAVARACIDAACHYVDLADGREFVKNFASLDVAAQDAGVTLVTGASTLPGISSSVIESHRAKFSRIESVEISVAPAHQTPRGLGTVRAVLGYCGKPVTFLRDGKRSRVYGWQDLRRQRYPGLGLRWFGACDVPDLDLVPANIAGLQGVSFHAGLEAWWEQLGLWLMAGLVRMKLVRDWSALAKPFANFSDRTLALGSDKGGMHIRIAGTGPDGDDQRVDWYLLADDNHGPEIPCTPSIVIVKKILNGEFCRRGAFPCWDLFSIAELQREMAEFSIRVTETEQAL